MHEMSIAQSIVELVEEHAKRDAFVHVKVVRVEIGRLSSVDPRALEFGFDVVARGTVADGATLTIERPSGRAYCMGCEKNVPITAHGEPCPDCGGGTLVVLDGDEMRVVDLEVE